MSTQPSSPEDASPPRRSLTLPLVIVAIAIVLFGAILWAGMSILRHQSYQRDAETVGPLNHKVAVLNQPLSDDEFEMALTLCEARDPETRFTALVIATADAVHRNPTRKSRVEPIAVKMLDDREPSVRARAIRCVSSLRLRDQLDRIRTMTQSPDPAERKAAFDAVAALESGT